MRKKKQEKQAKQEQEEIPVFQVESPAQTPQEETEPVLTFTADESTQDVQEFSVEAEAEPEIPFAQPVEKPKGEEFQCPECSKIFIVALTKRPLHIRCPYCGLEGMVD